MKTSARMREQTTELNFELYFVTEILKLSSLHYGFWEEGQASGEFDLDEIKQAQARFTERLIAFVPKDVETILDVGAGIGDNARALTNIGHRVTAISPDQNHARHFEKSADPKIEFHRSKFEEFESDRRFDLLLFSESHRYFDRQIGLRQCRRLVSPGGHLLVCGMFRHSTNKSFPVDFDLGELEYVTTARSHDFIAEKIVDITPNIIPTIDVMNHVMQQYLEPTLRMASLYLKARAPWKARLLNLIFSREGRDFERVIDKYRRKIDPERYRERFRYVTILFRDGK